MEGYSYYQESSRLMQNEQIEEALAACKKALELGYNCNGNVQCSASYFCMILKHYEESIAFADESLAIDSNNAISYGNKGISLKHLGRYQEAIENLDKSISLDPNNAFCLCHKASALNHLGREREAIEELKKASEIMRNNKQSSLLIEADKKFIMENIEAVIGLNAATQDTEKFIDTLESNNASALKVIAKFTQLKAAKDRVTNKMIDNIAEKQPKTSDNEAQNRKRHVLESLQKDPSQVLKILEEYPEAYTYPESVPYLIKSMSDLQKEAMADIKEIKSDVKSIMSSIEDLASEIKNMKQIMKVAGVYDKAKIKEGFQLLYDESPLLHEYAKCFYWTLLNYFAAYKSISTQIVNGNTGTATTSAENYMASGLEKASGYLLEMAIEGTKSVPVVGSIISLLDGVVGSIYTGIQEKRFEDRVSAINYVIMKNKDSQALLEEDFSTSIALAALDITMKKKNEILNPQSEKIPAKWQDAFTWLDTQISSINEAVVGKGIDVYDSGAAKAALKDVLLLMAYLYKNYEIVANKSTPLSEQFTYIILSLKSNEMLNSVSVGGGVPLQATERVEVFVESNSTRQICCSVF